MLDSRSSVASYSAKQSFTALSTSNLSPCITKDGNSRHHLSVNFLPIQLIPQKGNAGE